MKDLMVKLVRCRSCKTLQSIDLWKSKYYKKKENCCSECGKKSYIYDKVVQNKRNKKKEE